MGVAVAVAVGVGGGDGDRIDFYVYVLSELLVGPGDLSLVELSPGWTGRVGGVLVCVCVCMCECVHFVDGVAWAGGRGCFLGCLRFVHGVSWTGGRCARVGVVWVFL